MKLSTVFLDSSVILSGLASEKGGSGKIITAGKKKKLNLVTTSLIIQEVAKHLSKLSIDPAELDYLLSSQAIHLQQKPSNQIIGRFSKAIKDPDDAHVLAAAVISGAYVLVSLDKKHILTREVRKLLNPIQVLSPKSFWELVRKKKHGIG